MYKMHSLIITFAFLSLWVTPTSAQELHDDVQGTWSAKVLEVVSSDTTALIDGTGYPTQELKVRIMSGPEAGEEVQFKNDYIQLHVGDTFFINSLQDISGKKLYNVFDYNRRTSIYFLLAIFAIIVVAFGGMQGLRSLIALLVSLLAIVFVLIPMLLAGYSPILTSTAVASGILFVAIFATYGIRMSSCIAFAGTSIAVMFTGVLSYAFAYSTRLTGMASEEAAYLNLGSMGQLDMFGLLLAGFIIGSLGVLDDIAATQVAVVEELYATDPSLSRRAVYSRALTVGRAHVAALVNTLVLAYTGASLPLLLLFFQGGLATLNIINMEVFATEIVRSVVGSLGLIVAVPVTTALAVYFLKGRKSGNHAGHGHAHSHVH